VLPNRSIPACTVIPELAYPDIGQAIEWLCSAFGFTLRLRIANHRAQLNVSDGAIVLTELGDRQIDGALSILVRVESVDRLYERACASGARSVRPPADHPFGERQCTLEDFVGHRWTFSQSIADVDPATWGGTLGEL
jgi:uncharacterized glyoxalase superfamily protein PhnB